MSWAKGLGVIAALAVPAAVHAQAQTGRITGTVTVAPGGQPLTGANLVVVGTEIRGSTGPDGRFTLPNVPVGTHTVRAQRIGYAPATQTVVVAAGQPVATEEAKKQLLDSVEADLQTVGDDAQLANVDLQNCLQKMQQYLQMYSNISKTLHDGDMNAIRNQKS